MSGKMNFKNFIYSIEEMVFRYGKKWDLISPLEKDAKEFANININSEPNRYKNGNSNEFTSEYILAKYSMIINDRLRKDDLDYDIINVSKDIYKYRLKQDIVVYRGVHKNVMDTMIKSAKDYEGIDFCEKGFLNTSIVKGKEVNSRFKLRIYLPKRTCAFYAGNVNDEESIYYEVIVQKGAKLKILSKDREYINCVLCETD